MSSMTVTRLIPLLPSQQPNSASSAAQSAVVSTSLFAAGQADLEPSNNVVVAHKRVHAGDEKECSSPKRVKLEATGNDNSIRIKTEEEIMPALEPASVPPQSSLSIFREEPSLLEEQQRGQSLYKGAMQLLYQDCTDAALPKMREAAELNYIPACVWLFVKTPNSSEQEDLKQKIIKNINWFIMEAENGDPEAQVGLASCYIKGIVVQLDSLKAVKYFERAALKDHVMAQFSLGSIYQKGGGWSSDRLHKSS